MPLSPHSGQALSWATSGEILEVTLHGEPANEIGLTALGEQQDIDPDKVARILSHAL